MFVNVPPGEGTPWSAVYRCVIKKTMRKGTFFQEGQCAALTSFRVGKMSFLWKKGMFFTILLKRCEKGWTEASLADMFWAEMTRNNLAV